MTLPDKLITKVRNAALETYEEYSEEFSNLEPKQLFKTAYLHGYNCAYNIYDVAEEKVDGLIKEGERPINVPLKSLNVKDRTESYINRYDANLSNLSGKQLYENGYQQGFSDVWDNYIDISLNDGLENLVNYYLWKKKVKE